MAHLSLDGEPLATGNMCELTIVDIVDFIDGPVYVRLKF
jgi:hypothetical protein